ncbi:hypothetical protein FKW77_009576 [Venturia effusa]|uniref:N-alpha-acetyltransferase 40 n=1 Tax=Venturia effusa TaxID=50376 RepID=A0A517L047_9PEZI|nr:hypothetical protein FKW77_009576 [Venturia effusa]
MSPTTLVEVKRHSPTVGNQQRQKASSDQKLPTTTTISSRISRSQAARNLLHANALSSTRFMQQYIPAPSQTFTTQDGSSTYTYTFKRTQDLTPEEKEACFQIIKETSRRDYEANAEEGWDDKRKREEMGEEGMKFVLVREAPRTPQEGEKMSDMPSQPLFAPPLKATTDTDDTILGFTSFTLELDPDTRIPQLYIYEIHLLPPLRRQGIGRHLMSLNETIARNLGLEKCILTVFTCNVRAEALYRALGYTEDEDSPKERVLRSGKVVRPKYLILSKEV